LKFYDICFDAQAGYPAEHLKCYRDGMQDWLSAGMTTTRN